MAKNTNFATDSAIIQRIIDAGGTLHREDSCWRIGTTIKTITYREVRALNALGVIAKFHVKRTIKQ